MGELGPLGNKSAHELTVMWMKEQRESNLNISTRLKLLELGMKQLVDKINTVSQDLQELEERH